MAAPRVSFGDKELENGGTGNQSRAQSRKWSTAPGNIEDLDEYTALQKYISTYKDPKADLEAEMAEKSAKMNAKTKKSWQFWKKSAGPSADMAVVPDDWLETDIKQGVSNADVEGRRKHFGWNEITTEKENLFLKFLGFFTGPILYGMYHSFPCLSIAGSYSSRAPLWALGRKLRSIFHRLRTKRSTGPLLNQSENLKMHAVARRQFWPYLGKQQHQNNLIHTKHMILTMACSHGNCCSPRFRSP